jgi:hypothetical protein
MTLMTPGDGDQSQDAATLLELQAEYPHLRIGTEIYGRARVWVARGEDGHPWLVASDDLNRFRNALRQP